MYARPTFMHRYYIQKYVFISGSGYRFYNKKLCNVKEKKINKKIDHFLETVHISVLLIDL